MKQVIRCGACGKPTRKHGSFTAELTQRKMVGDIMLNEDETIKISMCRDCAEEAGYKVKGGNKQAFTKEQMAKAYYMGVHDGEVKSESMKKLGI